MIFSGEDDWLKMFKLILFDQTESDFVESFSDCIYFLRQTT